MEDEIILKGPCECGKCSVPSYPGRIYDKRWSCKLGKWVKDDLLKDHLKTYTDKNA